MDSSLVPKLSTHPARNRQTGNPLRPGERAAVSYLNVLKTVFVALLVAVLAFYIYFASSPAPGLGEQTNSCKDPKSLLIKTSGALFVVIVTWKFYLVAEQRIPRKRSKSQGVPDIRVDDVDPVSQTTQPEEPTASSTGLLAPGPGTLRPPISLQPLPSSPLRRGAPAAPPWLGLGSQPSSPSFLSTGFQTTRYPTAGGSRHAVATVEVTPVPRAWEQGVTSPGPPINTSGTTTWSPSTEKALHDWTFFLPVDRQMFGRVRKQPQDPRPIFCSPNCDVWKCEIEFSRPLNTHPDKVAVKVVRHLVPDQHDRVKALERMNARLNQEAITWAGVHHSNVVPLLGVIFSPIHALILPWYNNGNLGDYMRRFPSVNRFKLVYDISRGLEHLHSHTPKIVHADIKPENVLIDDKGDALLTDFGMATVLNEDHWYTPSHQYGGTYQWMAPEVLSGESERRSRTGDVYSFGSLTCYIMTDRMPHDSQRTYQILNRMNPNNPQDPIDQWHRHPQFQDCFGVIISGIIRRCWSRSPEDRPPMSVIVGELTALTDKRESLVPRQRIQSKPASSR